MEISGLGKFLLVMGLLLVVLGGVLIFVDKIPFLGRLPGDIRIERENFRFYFPLTTSILISIVVTVILWLISHFRK
jgi:heme/copper-type cytochrome/quinol oxidase subunit 2